MGEELEKELVVMGNQMLSVANNFPGVQESEDDRRKRKQRNQRRVSDGERRLCAVIGDLPPPPLAGSIQLEDEAYCAIRESTR